MWVKFKNKSAALQNPQDDEDNGDINRAWGSITENIKLSAKESTINHSFIRNVQIWLNDGSTLNYRYCKTQVK
jgi:hypothetical protein